MMNREIDHDSAFRQYRFRTVHEEIEFQRQTINLCRQTKVFISECMLLLNLQAVKAKTSAPASIQ